MGVVQEIDERQSRMSELEIENFRLRKELYFKDHNIRLLNKINANMRASLRTREVSFVILTGVTAEAGLGFNRAMIFLTDQDAPVLRGQMAVAPDSLEEMKRFYGEATEKKFGFEFYIEEFYRNNLEINNRLHTVVSSMTCDLSVPNILTEALERRRAFIVRHARPEDFNGIEALAEHLGSEFIAAPILCRGKEIGVIVADNFYSQRVIFDEDVITLQTLCDFAGSSVIAAQKYEDTEKLSIVDELTGLYNFRHLKEKLHEELYRAKRYSRNFSTLMIDIDYFKNFNDRNGHLTGNKALIDLARLIRSNVRSIDFPARYGGEEFVVLLPETNREGARIAAQKLCDAVRRAPFVGMENQPGGRVTISCGIAHCPEDGFTYDEIIGRADQLLYTAKASGKDQVR
ncbi:MAG: sensor domain-containing diguanylate cyclase [Candidatus Hydrogenedentota bacterium]